MKKRQNSYLSLAALVIATFTGCDQNQEAASKQRPASREISGTVYIVTAGAETLRLPMVQVVAFDIATNDAQKIIDAERLQAEQHLKELGKSLKAQYAVVSLNRIMIQIAREAREPVAKITSLFEDAKTNLTVAIGEWEKWQKETQPAFYGNNAFEKMGKPVSLSTTDVDGKFSTQTEKSNLLFSATAQRQTPGGIEIYYWLIPVPAGEAKVNVELNNKTLLEYSLETRLFIQKTTADVSKTRNEIETWLSQ